MSGWSSRGDEDPLAYGHYNPGSRPDDDETYESGDRGLIGGAFRRLRAKKQSYQGQQPYSEAVDYTYSCYVRQLVLIDTLASKPE